VATKFSARSSIHFTGRFNRIDELAGEEIGALLRLLEKHHPGLPVVRVSARTGEGFETLLDMLDRRGDYGRRILDIDYDVYAEGEAELGWLNGRAEVSAARSFSLDALLLDIMARLQGAFANDNAETAHLKVIGQWEGFSAVANLVSGRTQPRLSQPSGCRTRRAAMIVNARVAMAPQRLQEHVEREIAEAAQAVGGAAAFQRVRSLQPGRPVPTHRFNQPLAVLG
jgi:Fe2+ transport system protein B